MNQIHPTGSAASTPDAGSRVAPVSPTGKTIQETIAERYRALMDMVAEPGRAYETFPAEKLAELAELSQSAIAAGEIPVIDYDLVVVGAGSGNMLVNRDFRTAKVAIVEQNRFGGTCLNVGCIPTKMYVHAADVAAEITESRRFGISAQLDQVHWEEIKERVFTGRIDPLSAEAEEFRRSDRSPNTTVYHGTAIFVGNRTLITSDNGQISIIRGQDVVLAAGSRPFIPKALSGLKRDNGTAVQLYTNENIMRLPALPESMIIVGGGVVAAEFAHVFAALGVRVHVVTRSKDMLRRMDHQLSAAFTEELATYVDLHRSATITSAQAGEARNPLFANSAVTVTLQTEGSGAAADSSPTSISADALLVATGRTRNGDRLGAAASGVALTADGAVEVDAYGRTTAPHVWALGDVSSPYLLKHVANAETRTISHNMRNPEDLQPLPHDFVPAAVFSRPQLATVGLTEQLARGLAAGDATALAEATRMGLSPKLRTELAGHTIVTTTKKYGDTAFGWALEDTTSFVSLVADATTNKLLGAHIMGPQASTLIQPLITLMSYDLEFTGFARAQYWIHPALTEVVENALLDLEYAAKKAR